MKYGRFIVPAILLSASLVLAVGGDSVLDPLADLALRCFLIFTLPAWWITYRWRRQPPPEPAQHHGTAINARQLISGIEGAREALAAKRPKPDSVQHYRRTLLIQAHQAIAEAGYFKQQYFKAATLCQALPEPRHERHLC